jgi:nuclear pore complex protein Nup93
VITDIKVMKTFFEHFVFVGGVPSVIQLVKSYVTIKSLVEQCPGLDIAAGNVGPVWLITYLLLRCGKVSDATVYMRDQVCNTETAKLIEEYEKSGNFHLPFETESKIRMEYRRALKNSTRDPYKKYLFFFKCL